MKRAATIILFMASLIIVSVGTFYGGVLYGFLPKQSKDTPDFIVQEAKQKVARPTLPPKPAGKTAVEMREITQIIKIPAPTWTDPTRTRDQKISTQIPESKLIDASPEEIAAWDSTVKKLEDDYNRRLSSEIDRISREYTMRSAKEFAAAVKEISTDVIIPIILAIAGIIGALVSLKAAFKTKPADNKSDTRHM